ncbi:MAG: helix-turn-helix transcriptional regulator [Rubellimicrobium sp.]|nr:helix-turn-helix transcriptional regulator [Rubellimicrobium sp.]
MAEQRVEKAGTPAQPRVGPIIRALRRGRDMTLTALGDLTGLSVGYLSQVERDLATPSLGALTRIAHALGAGIDRFMPVPHRSGILNRAALRETTWVNPGGMTYQRLHGEFPGATFSAFDITLPPGFVGEIDRHEGEEFVRLLSGRVEFRIDGRAYLLDPGDTLHFRSDMEHQALNRAEGPSVLFWLGPSPVLRLREGGHGR